MIDTPSQTFLVAGKWIVNPELNEISTGGETFRFGPKVMQVLSILVENQGRVVSRQRLMDAVWTNTIVVEESLTRCISELRKVLHTDSDQQSVIRTIRKSGYVLVADVEPLDSNRQEEADGGELPSGSTVGPAGYVLSFVICGLIVLMAIVTNRRGTEHPRQAIPLTSAHGIERDPAISPDGRYVAYSVRSDSANNYDLVLMDQLLKETHTISSSERDELGAVWSPDGESVAYMRKQWPTCVLLQYWPSSKSTQEIGSCGGNAIADAAWFPQGPKIVYSDTIGIDRWAIFSFDLATANRKQLTFPPPGIHGDFDAEYSSDGSILTFTRVNFEESRDLYKQVVGDTVAKRITFEQRAILGHTWSVDNRDLYYSTNKSGNYAIWRLRHGSSQPEWLAVSESDLRYPTYNAGKLYAESWIRDSNIYLVDLESNQTLIASSTAEDLNPQFSPDDSSFAFSSNRSGSNQIWRYNLTTGDVEQLSFKADHARIPLWSNDRTLIYDDRPDGNNDAVMLDVNSRTTTRVTEHPADDGLGLLMQDQTTFIYTSDRNAEWQLRIRNLETRADSVLLARRSVFARPTDDVNELLFAADDGTGIWSLEISTGETHQLIDDLHETDWGNWSAVGSNIYYVRRTSQGDQVVEYNRISKAQAVILQFDRSWRIMNNEPSFSANSLGTAFLFSAVDKLESEIKVISLGKK